MSNFDKIKDIWLDLEKNFSKSGMKSKVEFIKKNLGYVDGRSNVNKLILLVDKSVDRNEDFSVTDDHLDDYNTIVHKMQMADKFVKSDYDFSKDNMDSFFAMQEDSIDKLLNKHAEDTEIVKSSAFANLDVPISEIPTLEIEKCISAEEAYKNKQFFDWIDEDGYHSVKCIGNDVIVIPRSEGIMKTFIKIRNKVWDGSASRFEMAVCKYLQDALNKDNDKIVKGGLYLINGDLDYSDKDFEKKSTNSKDYKKCTLVLGQCTRYLKNYSVFEVDNRAVDNTFGVYFKFGSD